MKVINILHKCAKNYNKCALWLIICAIFFSCGTSTTSKKIGDVVKTRKQCLSAITKDDYKSMTEISSRMDQPALMKMVSDNRVAIIPGNTTGTIRDIDFGSYLFEYDNGIDTVRMWVSTEFIE